MKKMHGSGMLAPEAPLRSKLAKVVAGACGIALAFTMFGCAGATSASGTANGSNESASSEASADANEIDLSFSKRDLDPSYDETTATKITLAGDTATVDGEGASVDGSTVTLSADATYIVTGELTDGQIVVDAGDEDKLQVVLAGASVTNADGPAFLVSNADKCFVTLADGTTNALADGANYQTDADDDADAALFSHDDLTINGTGTLTLTGNYKHAVASKDDLVITGGTISATATEDAFQGKDALKIADGTFTVKAGDDAFHSEYLFYVLEGTIDVETCVEGYEAQKVIIDGGEHNVYATDDAINAAVAEDDSVTTAGSAPTTTQVVASDSSTFSEQRGFGGGSGRGMDGSSSIESGQNDRMMPPDRQQDGQQNGTQDRQHPFSDDAMNGGQQNGFGNGANGGNGGFGGGMGGMAQSSDECLIQINGGTLTIIGLCDAIDSNGNVEINGGTLLVCGPSQGMDGALTFDLNAQINGGTVLMLGSADSTRGMDASEQAWAIETLRGNKGDTVSLIDATGSTIATLDAAMAFQTVIVSAPSIATGATYTIQVNTTPTTFTMS